MISDSLVGTDELVHEFYGLDAKDREVIEEFLRKF